MKSKDSFEYVVMMVQDYVNNLQPSCKLAVGERASQAIQEIQAALSEEDTLDSQAVPPKAP